MFRLVRCCAVKAAESDCWTFVHPAQSQAIENLKGIKVKVM
jgi:hypothetical protein